MSLYERVSSEVKKYCYETTGPAPSIIMPIVSTQSFLDGIIDFEVREDDTYIITYMKSGTTWIQRIVLLLLERSQNAPTDERHQLLKVPFLEFSRSAKLDMVGRDTGMYEIAAEMPSPRLLKTHLPSQLLPSQLKLKKPKVIYVARNPKDVAVSYYHFTEVTNGLPSYESWDNFIRDFTDGLAPRGSWFENVVYWWERRHEDNVFFVTYEEMLEDCRGIVQKVADFLGVTVSDDVIDEVTSLSSFSEMKKDPKVNPDGFFASHGAGKGKPASFMRKGQSGDWKNHFTDEQNEYFRQVHQEKMEKSGLDQLYQL